MNIDVLSIFPDYFRGPLEASLLGRGRAAGLLTVTVTDLRTFTTDRHRSVDDLPFGGGPGMVLAPGPFFAAVEHLYGSVEARPRTVLFTPRGRRLDQALVVELAAEPALLLLCGRYEGVDERVAEGLATDQVSLGDYVLAGGEVAACVLVEAVARLVPGVMGNAESGADESFSSGLLEYPQYTRPAEFRGMTVPEVLRGGHHAQIARWRREQALARTSEIRPDLYHEWVERNGDADRGGAR